MKVGVSEHDGAEEGKREQGGNERAGLHPFGFWDEPEDIFGNKENGGGCDGGKERDVLLVPLKEGCELVALVLKF